MLPSHRKDVVRSADEETENPQMTRRFLSSPSTAWTMEQPVDAPLKLKRQFQSCAVRLGVLCLCLAVLLIVIVTVVLYPKDDDSNDESSRAIVTQSPTLLLNTPSPTLAATLTPRQALLEFILQHSTCLAMQDLTNTTSSASSNHPEALAALEYILLQYEGIALNERTLQLFGLIWFYYTTGGDTDWSQSTDWLDPQVHECQWYTKSATPNICNAQGLYTALELDFNNLNGHLPCDFITFLPNLEILQLRGGPNAYLYGTLPTTGTWPSLQHLEIRQNQFQGTLPPAWGSQSSALTHLDVSDNLLTGTILVGDNWTQLEFANYQSNAFVGSLPTALGNSVQLKKLYLRHNQLTGTLPTQLGLLQDLQDLHLEDNQFIKLPTEMGLLTELDTLQLQNNRFAGTLPTELGLLQKLQRFNVAHNLLSGAIPSEFGQLQALRDELNLSHNVLGSVVPTELGLLTRLRDLQLQANQLVGAIPTELATLNRLNTVRLDQNQFTGSMPTAVCSVWNQTLPAAYADCKTPELVCPCCMYCCKDNVGCECVHLGTTLEFLC